MLYYFSSLRIPNVTVSMEEGDVELEISDDPFDCSRLDIKNIPLIVTLNKVGQITITIELWKQRESTLQFLRCKIVSHKRTK